MSPSPPARGSSGDENARRAPAYSNRGARRGGTTSSLAEFVPSGQIDCLRGRRAREGLGASSRDGADGHAQKGPTGRGGSPFGRLASRAGIEAAEMSRATIPPDRIFAACASTRSQRRIVRTRYSSATAEHRFIPDVAFMATESSRGAGQSPSRPGRRNARPVAVLPISGSRDSHMNRRKPTFFRNSLDMRDKVQVRVLRKRLKLSGEQFTSVVRKSGTSISAITKEAGTLR